MPLAPTVASASSQVIGPIAAEPSGGIVSTTRVESSDEQASTSDPQELTAAVAVVGQEAGSGVAVARDSGVEQLHEPVRPTDYAGFAGLLMLLSALALFVFRRKRDS
jgi:LPXTG-motif cell wall-anchored protein